MPPTRPAARSEMISPYIFSMTSTSNVSGRRTIKSARASMYAYSLSTSEYPAATSSYIPRKNAIERKTFALSTQVTFIGFFPRLRASSKA